MTAAPGARSLLPIACAVGVLGMVGLAYASVPLYRKFCQVTGFNGTVRRAEAGPTGPALDRTLTVRFDTNVRGLPWTFTPDQASQVTHVGGSSLAYFRVTNTSDHALTGRAAYNVAPESAGPYFVKTQCFCFSDQTITGPQDGGLPGGLFRRTRLHQGSGHPRIPGDRAQLHLLPRPRRQDRGGRLRPCAPRDSRAPLGGAAALWH